MPIRANRMTATERRYLGRKENILIRLHSVDPKTEIKANRTEVGDVMYLQDCFNSSLGSNDLGRSHHAVPAGRMTNLRKPQFWDTK
jgi:hypothetical protein